MFRLRKVCLWKALRILFYQIQSLSFVLLKDLIFVCKMSPTPKSFLTVAWKEFSERIIFWDSLSEIAAKFVKRKRFFGYIRKTRSWIFTGIFLRTGRKESFRTRYIAFAERFIQSSKNIIFNFRKSE